MSRIVSVPNKTEICNQYSKLLVNVNGPGLDGLHYASGRLARGERPHARLALLKDNGEVVSASRTKLNWHPYGIEAEFEFPNGLKVSQRTWIDAPFANSIISFKGSLSGARLIADGMSYESAKLLVSPQRVVMQEEINPSYKPFVLQISSSVAPDKVMLSTDGKNWADRDFIWGEQPVHYRMVWDKLPREMVLSAHLGKLSNWLEPKEWENARGRERTVKREWERALLEEYPNIECKDQRYRDLVQFCFYVHRSGIFALDGMLPYPFVCASKVTYPMWWSWDTSFHSIMDCWMDRSIAKGDLLNHTIMQSQKGCIQDAGGEFYADTGILNWVHPEQYDAAPPPAAGPCVNGMATWEVYQKTGDLDFLKKMYPHLAIFERFLVNEKPSKLDPDMIAYYNWCDVGWDDSKRWGKSGMGDHPDRVNWDLPVVPIDANVYFYFLRDTLSKAAGLLGDTEKQKEYAEKAARTRRAIDRLMWDEEEGFYFDLLPDGKKLDLWSPAGFTPMLAGIPGTDSYHRLREHLLDEKKFWTKYPVPTLAADDPDFSPISNWWRGSTWPVINWTITEGLFKYDPELGLKLLDSTVNTMTKDGFPTCREIYNPLTGEGGGAIDQGWATMPVDLILRRLYGLVPSPEGLTLNPHLPDGWNDSYVRNVFAAGTMVELRYLKSGSSLKAVLKNTGKKALAVTARGKQVSVNPGAEATIEM